MSIKKFIIIVFILICVLIIGLILLDYYSYKPHQQKQQQASLGNNTTETGHTTSLQQQPSVDQRITGHHNATPQHNLNTNQLSSSSTSNTPITQPSNARHQSDNPSSSSPNNSSNNRALANRVGSTPINSVGENTLNGSQSSDAATPTDSGSDILEQNSEQNLDSNGNAVDDNNNNNNNNNNDANVDTNDTGDATPETDTISPLSPGDITGRVFSNNGTTVSGINLTAVPFDIAAGQSAAAQKTLNTRSDEQGNYQFSNVAKAGYRVCTEISKAYSSACIRVLPPQKTADLKVTPLSSTVTLSGLVTDQENQALANVTVVSSIANAERTTSKADGRYSLKLKTSDNSNPIIYFSLPDHSEAKIALSNATPIGETTQQQFELNAQLTEKTGFSVTGLVQDTQGNPVSGQNISLRSAGSQIGNQLRYARSNAQGRFTIDNVQAAEDYYPIVVTNAEYRYRAPDVRPRIAVNGDDTNFTIELEQQAIDYGSLRLFLNSSDQLPLSGLSIDLYQNGRRVARSNTLDSGEAYFEKVPNGNISLTVSALSLRATGLQRNQHDGITLTADTGDNEVRITVVGADNQPIVCQQASINWRQNQNGLNVQSSRTVQTDQYGVIYASNFGSGQHTLNLSRCADHRNYSNSLQIGEQIEFQAQLTPLNQ